MTIEPGRNGTFGLGATNGPPYLSALYPILRISGQDFLPGSLVGHVLGDRLPMTGEIFIDTNRTLAGVGNYVDVRLLGQFSVARFLSYPYDGVGTIENLGDGWYRHHLANLSNSSDVGVSPLLPPTTVELIWNSDFDASSVRSYSTISRSCRRMCQKRVRSWCV